MTDHYILDASNNQLTVTNLFQSNNSTSTLGAAPLGTAGDSPTGELGTKVLIVGSTTGATVILGANTSTTAVTWTQATKAVAASGTPERLAAATTLCESVLLEGKLSRTGNNTGNVFVGTTSANDTQLLMIAPGGSITLSAPAGKKLDLNLIYVDVATNSDGITYTAFN